MALQHYNSNDLAVRTAVAACAIGCKAASAAKKWRQGSITFCEQKGLEISVAQLNVIRSGFSILLLPATSTVTVLGDGATSTPSTISVNGVVISDTFLYDTDNNTTAIAIAAAINSLTSVPDYTATVAGAIVTITAVTAGATINTTAVTTTGGDVTIAATFMTGGQDGVLAADNVLTEAEVEHMFNNIAEYTGCCYASLGYGYEAAQSTVKLGVPVQLNTGNNLLLNTGNPVRLNKPTI